MLITHEANPFANDWQLYEEDPIRGIKRYRLQLDADTIVQRTEYYRTEHLLDANAQDQSALAGNKWGDAQLVARIPLDLAWQQLMPAVIENDERYVAKWLNDADNAKFRVKAGTV